MAREEEQDSADLARELEWQRIVENYGERAVLEPEDEASLDDGPLDAVGARGVRDESGSDAPLPRPVDPDDEFVPPTPPPLPRPPLDRLLAWLGVFGVPALVLVLIMLGVGVPSWFGLLLAAGFLGGFGYLVLRMSDEPRDPWDDGAVL